MSSSIFRNGAADDPRPAPLPGKTVRTRNDSILRKPRGRLHVAAILFSIGLVVVAGRAAYLAFFTGGASGSGGSELLRGPVEDRHGFKLAVTEEGSTIGVAPHELRDAEFTAEQLSVRLNMERDEILEKIYLYKDRRYFLLKRQVDNLLADRIMDLNLPGVYREREWRRIYPGDTLASNLLGFVGRDQDEALAGLERDYNDTLIYGDPHLQERGPALRLSIDALVQHRMEKVMGRAFQESGSKRAAGVLMDIQTGEVLAMASFPNFDPNRYWTSNAFQRGNWNIRLNYEPGSTMKVFMAAALLNDDLVKPNERFHCDGTIHFHDSTVSCRNQGRVVAHGDLTLREIITVSCNVGIIKASQRLKAERLYEYMQELGFGVKTGMLPSGSGETEGYFPDLKNWVPSTQYYMPIGQGFSVTPVQLLRAGASLANGGELVQPFVAWKVIAPDGRIIEETEPESAPNPFRAEVNRAVFEMMRNAVREGTGRAADRGGVSAAGKTGTPEKSSSRGYLDKYMASFLGFFPADEPRYGMVILFDEPEGGAGGGSLAAPVFGDIVGEVQPFLEERNEVLAPEKLEPLPVHPPRVKPGLMYDFRGLAARDAMNIISAYYEVPVEMKGSGYVYGQTPEPGVKMQNADKIILYLEGLRDRNAQ